MSFVKYTIQFLRLQSISTIKDLSYLIPTPHVSRAFSVSLLTFRHKQWLGMAVCSTPQSSANVPKKGAAHCWTGLTWLQD